MGTMADTTHQMVCAGLTLEKGRKVFKVHRASKVYKDFRAQTDLLLELSDQLLTSMSLHPPIQILI